MNSILPTRVIFTLLQCKTEEIWMEFISTSSAPMGLIVARLVSTSWVTWSTEQSWNHVNLFNLCWLMSMYAHNINMGGISWMNECFVCFTFCRFTKQWNQSTKVMPISNRVTYTEHSMHQKEPLQHQKKLSLILLCWNYFTFQMIKSKSWVRIHKSYTPNENKSQHMLPTVTKLIKKSSLPLVKAKIFHKLINIVQVKYIRFSRHISHLFWYQICKN